GVGLLSLLTLFPLGALKMAEAIKDDRAALTGRNGQSVANSASSVDPTTGVVYLGMRNDPVIQAAMLGQANGVTPTADGPGFPVLVDPVGVLAYTGYTDPVTLAPWWQWVGGAPNTIQNGIPRVVGQWLTPVPTATQATLRWCTLQDDLVFVNDF